MRVEKSRRVGLLADISFYAFAIAPCAVVLGWHVWPLLAIWVVGGGLRVRWGDRKVMSDCWLFGIVSVIMLRGRLWEVVGRIWHDSGWAAMLVALIVSGVLLGCVHGRNDSFATTTSGDLPEGIGKWALKYPKPLIFPCRTTHARIFPKKHAFGYSYLLCGFPIVPAGSTVGGVDVGDGKDTSLGNWWLRIRAGDYLELGYGHLGFYMKLKSFLREQGVEDAEWSYAYLVTAPRFFGYSFNPVSFWYIYNQDHELKRMILEVNNTFGERRIYLLDGSGPSISPRASGSALAGPGESKNKFTDIWMKDFHVSPFNSRKGSYALKALNPFPSPTYGDAAIDNTITLKSSKGHGKIVARVHTTGKPLDPAQFGVLGTLRFVAGWWWVGLMTSPRIIKEAYKLYFWRSLHVWFRPEVLSSSIGRVPTAIEEMLQSIFKEYLNLLVHSSSEAFCITYQTGIPDRPKQMVATTHKRGSEMISKNLELRILSPAFYSRFVHYAHTSEAFDRECLFTDEKNRTLWISQPELLPLLLPKSWSTTSEVSGLPVERGYMDELRWAILKKLRCPPAEPAYCMTPMSAAFDVDDIRTLPYSDLDKFVRGPSGRMYAGEYRRMVTKIFLAQRFALGFTEVIDVLDLVLRTTLCWIGIVGLISVVPFLERYVGRNTGDANSAPFGMEWWWVSNRVVGLCSCHIYMLLKGYR